MQNRYRDTNIGKKCMDTKGGRRGGDELSDWD